MSISAVSGTWEIGENWPWPQVFFTSNYVLAAAIDGDDLSLYELINESNTWTANKVARLGYLARITSVDIADFGPYYLVAVSGTYNSELWKKLLARYPSHSSSLGALETINSSTIPFGTSICNLRGQLIIGGLSSGDIKWQNLGECAVAWGGIGNIEFDPAVDPSAGFAKMPWDSYGKGKVYKVLPMKNNFWVYGDRGICSMVSFVNDKVTGYGFGVSLGIGVIGTNAVAGDDQVHCFVDTNYDLWLVNEEGPKNLGYRNFLKTLNNGTIIVSFDKTNTRFYISDGSYAFVLNSIGLYSTHQCVTSIGTFNNILCGFVKDNLDTKFRLVTSGFDLGYQSMKTIEAIEFGLDYKTATEIEPKAALSVKYDLKGSYKDLNYLLLNERGILTQKATGRNFKINLRGTYDASADFVLSSLTAKIKFTDKRNIRGRINVS